MAQLTQEQLDKILANKPAGTSNETLLATLKARGHSFDFEAPQSSLQEQPKKGLLQKATDVTNAVFPGGKVGESIGTLGGFGLTALKEKLGLAPKGTTSQYDLSAPKPTQVAGDIASGALTVAGFKGAGIGKTALGTIGKGSVLGAGFGASEALKEGGGIKDVAKGAVGGAVVGGVVSGAGAGLEKALTSTLQNLPSRFVQSAIGQTKKEILAGKDLTKFITENKKIGSASGLLKQSQDAIGELDSKITNILNTSTKKFTRDSIVNGLAKSEVAKNALLKPADIIDTVSKVAPQARRLLTQKSLSIKDLNKLRQQIDRSLGSKVFDAPEVAFQKEVAKDFTNKLRALVQRNAPETKDLFQTYSQEIRLRDALTNKIQRGNKNQIISFGDLIGGGLGGVTGGVPGAIAGAGIRRAVQSTPVLTGGAVIADQLSKTLLPTLQKLDPAIQTEIISAIEKALTSSEN
jgi:hypothetical protein